MRDKYIYPAIFTFAEDGISIEFPDLPGCLPSAHGEEEALSNAKEALELHLFGMEEDRDNIPEPSKIQELTVERNQAVVLIEAWMTPFRDKMATKSVNQMTTLPKWLRDLALQKNLNFSHELQSSLKNKLGIYDFENIRKPTKKP